MISIGNYSWNTDPDDPMIINIFHKGQKVMSFFLGEAIESAGRTAVMRHIEECDRSHWLEKWQKEKHNALIDIIKNAEVR